MMARDNPVLQRPDLAPGQIDLWYCYLDRTTAQSQLAQYRKILTDREQDRLSQLRMKRVHDEYLVARALVRSSLSYYGNVAPSDWLFTEENLGKPLVHAPWKGFASFNLSHSARLIVCAVAGEGLIGVDVESLDRRTTGLSLARRFFSRPEVEMLTATPKSEWQETFLQIWTLKESYLKAIGHGLSMPLDQFFFEFPTGGPAELHLVDRPARVEDDWLFAQLRLPSRHHISLAVSMETERKSIVVRAREVIPLGDVISVTPIICSEANNWYSRNE